MNFTQLHNNRMGAVDLYNTISEKAMKDPSLNEPLARILDANFTQETCVISGTTWVWNRLHDALTQSGACSVTWSMFADKFVRIIATIPMTVAAPVREYLAVSIEHIKRHERVDMGELETLRAHYQKIAEVNGRTEGADWFFKRPCVNVKGMPVDFPTIMNADLAAIKLYGYFFDLGGKFGIGTRITQAKFDHDACPISSAMWVWNEAVAIKEELGTNFPDGTMVKNLFIDMFNRLIVNGETHELRKIILEATLLLHANERIDLHELEEHRLNCLKLEALKKADCPGVKLPWSAAWYHKKGCVVPKEPQASFVTLKYAQRLAEFENLFYKFGTLRSMRAAKEFFSNPSEDNREVVADLVTAEIAATSEHTASEKAAIKAWLVEQGIAKWDVNQHESKRVWVHPLKLKFFNGQGEKEGKHFISFPGGVKVISANVAILSFFQDPAVIEEQQRNNYLRSLFEIDVIALRKIIRDYLDDAANEGIEFDAGTTSVPGVIGIELIVEGIVVEVYLQL